MSDDNRIYEPEFTPFTEAERLKLGDDLAREISAIQATEAARASTVAGYAAELKEHKRIIVELSDKLTAGGCYRDIEVFLMLDAPEPGMKSILRARDNKVIRTERMTPKELQGSFGFTEPEDPK